MVYSRELDKKSAYQDERLKRYASLEYIKYGISKHYQNPKFRRRA